MNIILSIFIIITSFQLSLAQQKKDIEFVSINKTKANFNTIVNENELTVFVFYSTECPICIKSLKSLKNIMLDFDINFYFVYPTETNSKKGIKKFHKINNLSQDYSKVILDENKIMIKHLDAKVTPQFFLVDKKGEILYSGKIDNQFERIGVQKIEITESYLYDAVMSFRNKEEIKIKNTVPVGCLINR